jgi:hypothetical protein
MRGQSTSPSFVDSVRGSVLEEDLVYDDHDDAELASFHDSRAHSQSGVSDTEYSRDYHPYPSSGRFSGWRSGAGADGYMQGIDSASHTSHMTDITNGETRSSYTDYTAYSADHRDRDDYDDDSRWYNNGPRRDRGDRDRRGDMEMEYGPWNGTNASR